MNASHHSQKNETPPSINQKLSQKGVVEWHLAVNFNLKTTDAIIIIYINACKTVDRHLSPDYIVILWFTAHTICESSFVTTLYLFCHVSSGLLFFPHKSMAIFRLMIFYTIASDRCLVGTRKVIYLLLK